MRPITDILREYRKGIAVKIATELLADVTRHVMATGKAGKVTIELVVNPEKGGGNQLSLQAKVSHKLPYDDLPEAVFFADKAGDLHRTDPDQGEMFDPVTGEISESGPRAVS